MFAWDYSFPPTDSTPLASEVRSMEVRGTTLTDEGSSFMARRGVPLVTGIDADSRRALGNALPSMFSVGDPLVVARLLGAAPELFSVIMEAHAQILRVFGIDPLLLLTEARDDLGSLHITIRTRQSAVEALALLDRLDDEWWLDALPRTNGHLSIHLDCVL